MTEKDLEEKFGGDPHHPDHPRNRNKQADKGERKGDRIGGDPHHPDHPRNAKKKANERTDGHRLGGDPHDPNHPRNQS